MYHIHSYNIYRSINIIKLVISYLKINIWELIIKLFVYVRHHFILNWRFFCNWQFHTIFNFSLKYVDGPKFFYKGHYIHFYVIVHSCFTMVWHLFRNCSRDIWVYHGITSVYSFEYHAKYLLRCFLKSFIEEYWYKIKISL